MTIAGTNKTVYIVDDDQIYVYGIKKLITLKKLTPRLLEFKNGKEAIDYLCTITDKHLLPDIILLDLNMPVLDGWGFMERFVELKPRLGKNITIYIVSSSISASDIDRAKKITEVADYIMKPLSKDQLAQLFATVAA
jgi:CheY-like chemotaxis protein